MKENLDKIETLFRIMIAGDGCDSKTILDAVNAFEELFPVTIDSAGYLLKIGHVLNRIGDGNPISNKEIEAGLTGVRSLREAPSIS